MTAIERIFAKPSVYFVQSDVGGPVKIGSTKWVSSRIVALQIGSPFPLQLLGVIDQGGCDLERQLHTRFASSRTHGEWFLPTDELIEFIESNATSGSAISSSRERKMKPIHYRQFYDQCDGRESYWHKLKVATADRCVQRYGEQGELFPGWKRTKTDVA